MKYPAQNPLKRKAEVEELAQLKAWRLDIQVELEQRKEDLEKMKKSLLDRKMELQKSQSSKSKALEVLARVRKIAKELRLNLKGARNETEKLKAKLILVEKRNEVLKAVNTGHDDTLNKKDEEIAKLQLNIKKMIGLEKETKGKVEKVNNTNKKMIAVIKEKKMLLRKCEVTHKATLEELKTKGSDFDELAVTQKKTLLQLATAKKEVADLNKTIQQKTRTIKAREDRIKNMTKALREKTIKANRQSSGSSELSDSRCKPSTPNGSSCIKPGPFRKSVQKPAARKPPNQKEAPSKPGPGVLKHTSYTKKASINPGKPSTVKRPQAPRKKRKVLQSSNQKQSSSLKLSKPAAPSKLSPAQKPAAPPKPVKKAPISHKPMAQSSIPGIGMPVDVKSKRSVMLSVVSRKKVSGVKRPRSSSNTPDPKKARPSPPKRQSPVREVKKPSGDKKGSVKRSSSTIATESSKVKAAAKVQKPKKPEKAVAQSAPKNRPTAISRKRKIQVIQTNIKEKEDIGDSKKIKTPPKTANADATKTEDKVKEMTEETKAKSEKDTLSP